MPSGPANSEQDAERALLERRESRVARLQAMGEERGEVLFEMEWMTPKAARRRFWILQFQSLVIMVELLVVFAVLFVVAAVLAGVLGKLTGSTQ